MIPVAWVARVSDKDKQDPTLSLPRQLANVRAALPSNFVIVAHFWDVESGRLDLDKRGRGSAYEMFDIPIPRDGGIHDLLDEAKQPTRRFVAVAAESVSRIARVTYFGTKIEYELEKAGVALLSADEGISPDILSTGNGTNGKPKKAGQVLTRRVHQVVSEWYVLNLLEQSWDGFIQHADQGWNVGKPPYGYTAKRFRHPVPAKAAEGRTKHRLVPDPVLGPVVTQIYVLRTVERLGYGDIAVRLNADPELYPPPMPIDPARAAGRWTHSAVREILHNPKYTGYMVWNRRARKKGGKLNPPSEWVWSPQPVHEPLVSRESFEAAQAVARERERSRSGSTASTHPRASRTYLLRSYLVHDTCERRMLGKTQEGYTYYACRLRPSRDGGREHVGHPNGVWLREDVILPAIHDFFATRVLGPDRRQYLAKSLTSTHDDERANEHQRRRAALEAKLSDLQRRQAKLVDELEDPDNDLDGDLRKAFRQRLHQRFAELTEQIRATQADLDNVSAQRPEEGRDVELLDALPEVRANLNDTPEPLQRALYEAYRLKIRYNDERREAQLSVTITNDTLDSLTRTSQALAATGAGTSPSAVCPGRDSNPQED